ncbi:flagellar basal body-associated FliL family protein [Clostridium sp. SYSU_GA19001]|uniref:flagellar basal body-associated FliL family protein n=1 Tax=Clostridium caldaquaticum TaxID=2940653 RepID=UPI00207722F3|nr:flagellar basal body-associated FliL family protein [Clostridium caldaquaticum]MCM8710979.1 flagellar basal body-associated FliL family protein [Clostridium caldaquaticum]
MADKKEKGNGHRLQIIIIILLVLILIFGLAFGGYMIFFRKDSNTASADTQNTKVLNPAASEISPFTYSLDEFLVNLSDEGGKKYIKVKIYIGYTAKDEKKISAELEEKKPILRDAINSVLRSKKSTDITTEKSVSDLKKEIINRVNPYLEYATVNNIYFYDIIVQ